MESATTEAMAACRTDGLQGLYLVAMGGVPGSASEPAEWTGGA